MLRAIKCFAAAVTTAYSRCARGSWDEILRRGLPESFAIYQYRNTIRTSESLHHEIKYKQVGQHLRGLCPWPHP